MKTTVIITGGDNLSRSLISLLENTTPPTNICMVFDNTVSENQWATARAIMGGCCGNTLPVEESTDDGTLITNSVQGINYIAYRLNAKKNANDLKNIAVNKLKNVTDIFFTLSSGTAYATDLIEKYLLKFRDPIVKGVYSDYYNNGEFYLQSFNAMMSAKIDVKEFAFRNCDITFKTDAFSFLSELYTTGVIAHIPEFLFSI